MLCEVLKLRAHIYESRDKINRYCMLLHHLGRKRLGWFKDYKYTIYIYICIWSRAPGPPPPWYGGRPPPILRFSAAGLRFMGYGRWKPERNVFSHSSFYSYFHRSELTEQLEPKHRVGSPNTCIGVAIGSPVNPCVIFLARWVVLEPSRIACIFSVAHTQPYTIQCMAWHFWQWARML